RFSRVTLLQWQMLALNNVPSLAHAPTFLHSLRGDFDNRCCGYVLPVNSTEYASIKEQKLRLIQ
ncbi:25796_t:CDS:1, partial [Gigaspora rosea]